MYERENMAIDVDVLQRCVRVLINTAPADRDDTLQELIRHCAPHLLQEKPAVARMRTKQEGCTNATPGIR